MKKEWLIKEEEVVSVNLYDCICIMPHLLIRVLIGLLLSGLLLNWAAKKHRKNLTFNISPKSRKSREFQNIVKISANLADILGSEI